MTDKINNSEKHSDEQQIILTPELLNQLKREIKEEVRIEIETNENKNTLRKQEEQESYNTYVEKMKTSPDPWVDIVGWDPTTEGVKVQLEWNDAFVSMLRKNGIVGIDEEQIVQRWITMVMQEISSQVDESTPHQMSEFE